METNKTSTQTVLAIMAHPDDIEFNCAGTLRLLVERGWTLGCATTCGGDLGAPTGTRDAIRSRRFEESQAAAKALGGSYRWAGINDLEVHYCPQQLQMVTDIIRHFQPSIVITHSPECYMLDHEETSKLVRMACFAAGIPLYDSGKGQPTANGVPALYYVDPLDGIDKFGNPVKASFHVNIESTFTCRQQALACHASQREWLKAHHGIDNYLDAGESLAREAGQIAGFPLAEGFRQHLGHGYPKCNTLAAALDGLTTVKSQ